MLEFLCDHLGEPFDGTVTGVTARGVYVQIDRYLVDGFMVDVDEFLARKNDSWEQALEVEISEMRLNQLRALGYSMPEIKNPKKRRETGVD